MEKVIITLSLCLVIFVGWTICSESDTSPTETEKWTMLLETCAKPPKSLSEDDFATLYRNDKNDFYILITHKKDVYVGGARLKWVGCMNLDAACLLVDSGGCIFIYQKSARKAEIRRFEDRHDESAQIIYVEKTNPKHYQWAIIDNQTLSIIKSP